MLQARLEEALMLPAHPSDGINIASPVDNVVSLFDGLLQVVRMSCHEPWCGGRPCLYGVWS